MRRWKLLGEDDEVGISLLEDAEALTEPPRVYITFEVMKKILCFVKLVPGEINGWGWVKKQNNNFIVYDLFILEQRVSAGKAEENPLALNRLVGECEDPSKLRFQWHSHGNGLVFFSPEDRATIKRHPTDFMISFVINKQSQYKCRLDLYQPFYAGFEVPIWIILPIDEKLIGYCREEIKNKVKEDGLTNFGKKLPGFIKKPLGIKNDEWKQEESPAALPLEDLISQGEGEIK